MTTQKITLTIDSATADGRFFTRGSARIVPSFLRLGDPADQVLIEQSAARVTFGGDWRTAPTVSLFPNDLIGPQNDDGPGWTYTVFYDSCPGNPPPWSFYLLSTGGILQRLSSLAAVPAAAPFATGADKNFTQEFTATLVDGLYTVSVAHNLGKFPSVTVFDSAGDQCGGTPNFVDLNNLVLTFSAPFGGTVTCN